ncbi:MAG TPA: M20/M25/M40 family metallo-hydrolase [Spirochaetales bacterium]|nr:M20/M25/M40 family metallo-hydrolase [Spirochaetales bacterium]HRY53622.1 M20/M25/M40 family metallo-hydrolase [Spirochaetia bacterium]HRZ64626.1 M20/M25/M40 family metallo-hydrolase [Spirochaetia bacterium]
MAALVLGALAALLALLAARAAAFKPRAAAGPRAAALDPAASPPCLGRVDAPSAAARLAEMLRRRTVSSRDLSKVDYREYESFIELLPGLYPAAHRAMTREVAGGYSLLYHWKGRSASEPLVLMAHYDVVAAEGAGWSHPPFSGRIAEGKVWGRGSLDTKCTLCCALEAVELLAASGCVPERDIYLSFGHDEEVAGEGTPAILALLALRGVQPGLVLDEGGGVVEGVFPGVTRPAALIGVAEKGITDLELSARSPGGHASTPPRRGAAAALARAVLRLERRPFPPSLPRPTLAMLGELGRHAPFGLRLVLANLWLFRPLLAAAFAASGGETGAMCRTTTAVTMLAGSEGANILPARVSAVVNMRIAIGETVEGALARIRRVVADPRIELALIHPGEPSPVSETEGPSWELVAGAASATYPEAVAAPYVALGATDARHYARLCPRVYRFSPFEFSKAERASMHAVDEAIPVAKLGKGIEFYLRLIAAYPPKPSAPGKET